MPFIIIIIIIYLPILYILAKAFLKPMIAILEVDKKSIIKLKKPEK